MIRICCVEDDSSIRDLITYTLNASGFSAVGFEYAHDFFSEIELNLPHLVLLDLMLPDMDGMEILKKLRSDSRTENLPIILLTAKNDRLDKIKGLDFGADDYITKPFDILELLSRIRAVLRRSQRKDVIASSDLQCGDITINSLSHKVYISGNEISLTFKEYELLSFLLQNKNVAMSRSVLMNKIWGIDFEGETRTLDAHIRSLRQKLGTSGHLIETVRNVGYRVTDNV